jgi:hypothetical protein
LCTHTRRTRPMHCSHGRSQQSSVLSRSGHQGASCCKANAVLSQTATCSSVHPATCLASTQHWIPPSAPNHLTWHVRSALQYCQQHRTLLCCVTSVTQVGTSSAWPHPWMKCQQAIGCRVYPLALISQGASIVRHIGLDITVYKVQTRMLAFAMADNAERQCILSAYRLDPAAWAPQRSKLK